MAGGNSINLFEFNQKYCQSVGIGSESLRIQFNSINSIYVICVGQYAVTLIAFAVYDAKTMAEYGVIFFTLTCLCESAVAYFITIWQLNGILKYIDYCEQFIKKSKYKSVPSFARKNPAFLITTKKMNIFAKGVGKAAAYKELIAKIDEICKWLCYAILVSITGIVLFPILYTGFNYYIMDYGVESYFLYPPTKFVHRNNSTKTKIESKTINKSPFIIFFSSFQLAADGHSIGKPQMDI